MCQDGEKRQFLVYNKVFVHLYILYLYDQSNIDNLFVLFYFIHESRYGGNRGHEFTPHVSLNKKNEKLRGE